MGALYFSFGCTKNRDDSFQDGINNPPITNENRTFSKYQVFSEIPENWQEANTFVAVNQGERFVYFTGRATAMDIQAAKDMALLDAQSKAARAIKEITLRQLVVIKNTNPNIISNEMVVTIEKRLSVNVNISGLLNVKNHVSQNTAGVTYTVLMSMEYAVFVKRRNEALLVLGRTRSPDGRRMAEITDALAKLDITR